MFEKVNPSHPDKIADRIAGAMVDLAYANQTSPKVAVEILIGHDNCHIIAESSFKFTEDMVLPIVKRISNQENIVLDLLCVEQDIHLSENQSNNVRCGDNGIFKGVPKTQQQGVLSSTVKSLYNLYPTDGKYVLSNGKIIACQSCVSYEEIKKALTALGHTDCVINPLGDWVGGIDVDTGATNRKLGSDMGDSVTGGGLHGKDLSKADVSVNIYAWLKAQETKKPVELFCAIGDEFIDGKPYEDIVKIANDYIQLIGGFEKFAEWGLV